MGEKKSDKDMRNFKMMNVNQPKLIKDSKPLWCHSFEIYLLAIKNSSIIISSLRDLAKALKPFGMNGKPQRLVSYNYKIILNSRNDRKSGLRVIAE